MTPELSHRLGDALGAHDVNTAERATVTDAADQVDTFDQLPPDVQTLVVQIEGRPLLYPTVAGVQ